MSVMHCVSVCTELDSRWADIMLHLLICDDEECFNDALVMVVLRFALVVGWQIIIIPLPCVVGHWFIASLISAVGDEIPCWIAVSFVMVVCCSRGGYILSCASRCFLSYSFILEQPVCAYAVKFIKEWSCKVIEVSG
jgi:hypothetical protein